MMFVAACAAAPDAEEAPTAEATSCPRSVQTEGFVSAALEAGADNFGEGGAVRCSHCHDYLDHQAVPFSP